MTVCLLPDNWARAGVFSCGGGDFLRGARKTGGDMNSLANNQRASHLGGMRRAPGEEGEEPGALQHGEQRHMELYQISPAIVVFVVPALIFAALAWWDRLRHGPPDLSNWWKEKTDG